MYIPISPLFIPENLTIEEILGMFVSKNVDRNTTTIIARRRYPVQSACMALKQSYFAWHRTPSIEFVGECADDYGGPRRELFRQVFIVYLQNVLKLVYK